MKVIAVIFLCEVVLGYALDCSPNPNFVPVSSSIQLSNQLPTPIQAIVPSLQFDCPSLITGGNIRAVGASNFDIQVWRPQDDTGTLYNLVWRRKFRTRSTRLSSVDAFINSSFSMSPGVPVRPGDIIGFYSLEPARLLYTSSLQLQDEIIYTEAIQGPLCNFSLAIAEVQRRASALPLISLTYASKTNQDIQAAEQRLPLIEESCVITAILDNSTIDISTMTTPTAPRTRDGDSEQATTLPKASDFMSVSEAPTLNISSDDSKILSLSLLELILLVVILSVVIIAIFVIISVACCCCLYMQRLQMAKCEGKTKQDERHIIMNMNPAYQTLQPHAPTQSSTAQQTTNGISTCKIELQPCVPSTCTGSQQSRSPVASGSHYQVTVSAKTVHQYSLNSPGNDDYMYSYPKLRVEPVQDDHQCQHTDEGYIMITQSDVIQCRQEPCGGIIAANMENNGSRARGILDHTL